MIPPNTLTWLRASLTRDPQRESWEVLRSALESEIANEID
jgi:hypothetical protein